MEHELLCEIYTTSIIKNSQWQNLENAILNSRLLVLTIDFDIYSEIKLSSCLDQWFLKVQASPRGVNKFSDGRKLLRAPQRGKFDQ